MQNDFDSGDGAVLVRLAVRFELEPPVGCWKQVRDEIHQTVYERGYDPDRRTCTLYHGSKELDASGLNFALVGFLPGSDERMAKTTDAIGHELGREAETSAYHEAA